MHPRRWSPPRAGALERSAGRGTGGGTVEVVCSISYATHGGPYAYQYGRIRVKLPAASRSADGNTRQYRFRNHAGTQIVGAANCTIPATELAAAHLDRFFGVKQRGGSPSGNVPEPIAIHRSTRPRGSTCVVELLPGILRWADGTSLQLAADDGRMWVS